MFNRMRIYTVHVKPDDKGINFKPVFVKEGFTWPGFVFVLLWALYHRLWLPAILLVVAEFLMVLLTQAHLLTHFSMLAIHFGFHLFVGYQGNDWLRNSLKRRGYIVSDITAGHSFLHAVQRYLERLVAVG